MPPSCPAPAAAANHPLLIVFTLNTTRPAAFKGPSTTNKGDKSPRTPHSELSPSHLKDEHETGRFCLQEPLRPGGPRPAARGPGAAPAGDRRAGQPALELQLPVRDASEGQL